MGSDERPDATVLAQSICIIMEELRKYELMTAQGEPAQNARMDCLRVFATIHDQARVLLEHSAIKDFPEVLDGINVICSYAEDVLSTHAIYGDTKALEAVQNVQHFREDCARFLNELAQKFPVDIDSSKQLVEYSKRTLGLGAKSHVSELTAESTATAKDFISKAVDFLGADIKRADFVKLWQITAKTFDRGRRKYKIEPLDLPNGKRGYYATRDVLQMALDEKWLLATNNKAETLRDIEGQICLTVRLLLFTNACSRILRSVFNFFTDRKELKWLVTQSNACYPRMLSAPLKWLTKSNLFGTNAPTAPRSTGGCFAECRA